MLPVYPARHSLTMPELPEVETIRRYIMPYIQGKYVIKVIIREYRLRSPIPRDLNQQLAGLVITQVKRRAKYLVLCMSKGFVIIHLGMSGSLRIINPAKQPVEKHDHVDFILSDSLCLRYTDPRRFGAILWTTELPEDHKLLKNLGPEPLTDDFHGLQLFTASRGRTQAIKTFIMNSYIVAGIGNIYANEALFYAGIRPQLPCGKISSKRYQVLANTIKEVLNKAIEQGGTTLKDFVGGDGKPGYFKQQLVVYDRKGQCCTKCGTIIIEIRQGNRATYFCKHCQK